MFALMIDESRAFIRLFPCMDTYFHQKFDIENNEKNNSDSDVDDSVGDSE